MPASVLTKFTTLKNKRTKLITKDYEAMQENVEGSGALFMCVYFWLTTLQTLQSRTSTHQGLRVMERLESARLASTPSAVNIYFFCTFYFLCLFALPPMDVRMQSIISVHFQTPVIT